MFKVLDILLDKVLGVWTHCIIIHMLVKWSWKFQGHCYLWIKSFQTSHSIMPWNVVVLLVNIDLVIEADIGWLKIVFC